MEDLRPGNALYDDLKFVEDMLGGTLPLEVIVNTHTENTSLNPVNLNKMQAYKNEILQIHEIKTGKNCLNLYTLNPIKSKTPEI